jgi:hypothetical protein
MEEYRKDIFENVVHRRIFGPKRDVVADGCRNLLHEELHNIIFAKHIRMIEDEMGGNVVRMGRR